MIAAVLQLVSVARGIGDHGVSLRQDKIEPLILEFQAVLGLTDANAQRSAFCAVAHNAGWNSARIGRYLGVSRARAGQRIDKLRGYSDKYTEYMPVLTRLVRTAKATEPTGTPDTPVGFPPTNWRYPEFSLGILSQLTT